MRSVIWLLTIVGFAICGLDSDYINFGLFTCPREETGLGRCMRDILNSFIPFLSTGVPNLGIPSCEPLVIHAVQLQHATGDVVASALYTDVSVYGFSAMRAQELQFREKKSKIIGKIFIPQLKMQGNYKLLGHVMRMPINGEGKFAAFYDDIDVNVTIKLGRSRQSNGDEALICEALDVKFDIEDASIEFENLRSENYNGNALSKNWGKLALDLKEAMERNLHDFLKPIIDYAFVAIKPGDLFPTIDKATMKG